MDDHSLEPESGTSTRAPEPPALPLPAPAVTPTASEPVVTPAAPAPLVTPPSLSERSSLPGEGPSASDLARTSSGSLGPATALSDAPVAATTSSSDGGGQGGKRQVTLEELAACQFKPYANQPNFTKQPERKLRQTTLKEAIGSPFEPFPSVPEEREIFADFRETGARVNANEAWLSPNLLNQCSCVHHVFYNNTPLAKGTPPYCGMLRVLHTYRNT